MADKRDERIRAIFGRALYVDCEGEETLVKMNGTIVVAKLCVDERPCERVIEAEAWQRVFDSCLEIILKTMTKMVS